jgi:hypothetical protein
MGTSSLANSTLSMNFTAPFLSACSLAISSIAKDIATVGRPIVRGFKSPFALPSFAGYDYNVWKKFRSLLDGFGKI